MSDVLPTASRVPTADGAPDPYDHAINLVDTTAESLTEPTRTRTGSPSGSRRRIGIARIPTRSSVKNQLIKRKYARYQESRYEKGSTVTENGTGSDREQQTSTPPNGISNTVDFAPQDQERPKDKLKKKQPKHEYAIDVLYENQRGSFILGIPLYSHSSLLNFDPSPWVSKDFKDSPVNITNAQVPDPSWEWAWKTWYVDMSHDVDEEGWQYSFSFSNSFSWHGTHPWFHSFVRRRRWLRKRIKHQLPTATGPKASNLSAAHRLTAEYFTIHPKRDRSPDSARPQSYTSVLPPIDFEEPPAEITDIGTLLKALRLANIDREKIDIVKRFVSSAPPDELAYLGPLVADIMSYLVFQNSRRQLLAFLKLSAESAQQDHPEEDTLEIATSPSKLTPPTRTSTLLSAVEEADKQIVGLEYWSDRKHVLQTADPERETTQAIATIFDPPAPRPDPDANPAAGIRGISGQAEVGRDGSKEVARRAAKGGGRRRGTRSDDDDDEDVAGDSIATGVGDWSRASKGKEREDQQEREESPQRLKVDQVLIPD